MTNAIPVFLYPLMIGAIVLTVVYRVEAGFVCLLPLVQLEALRRKFEKYPQGNNMMDFLMVGIFVKTLITGKLGRIGRTPVLSAILLLTVVTIISLFIGQGGGAVDPSNPYLIHWKNFMLMPFLFIIAFCNIENERHVVGLLVMVVVAMMIGDVRFHFTFEHLRGEHYHHGMRFSALANFGPNEFSALVGQTTVLLFGILSCVKERKVWLVSVAPILANLYVVLFSYSRSGWLSLMAGVCIIGVVRKRIILVLLLVLVLGYKFILPSSVVERIEMTQGEGGELDHASASRISVWKEALQNIAANPIGVGFEGFRALGLGEKNARDAHNMYLKIALEWGILGLLVYLYLYFLALKRGWLVYRRGTSGFARGFGLGFVCATAANMVGNFFDQHFGWFDVTGNWWLYWAGVEWFALHRLKGGVDRNRWRAEAGTGNGTGTRTSFGAFGIG